jgi:hypothetical protein
MSFGQHGMGRLIRQFPRRQVMRNKGIRWTLRAVLVAGIAVMFAVAGGCDTVVTELEAFGSNDVFDAAIIGLQGDLATNCGGFGCTFDFGGF